ncbi:MAG: LptE family protein [bacterium]
MNRLHLLPVALLVFGLASCATTHQTTLGENYSTISIPVFKNETMEVGLEETITASVIRAFVRDRRLRVTDRSHADVVLEGRITQVDIEAMGFTDVDRAIGYNMTMVVQAQLVDGDTGQVLTSQPTFTVRGPFLLSNEPTTERQQDIASTLADSMISRFLDGW